GHDTGSFGGVVPFNPYAAMPSMHVGWSLLVGIFGFRALRGNPLRWLFALHPVVMAIAVTATGNHYFLDSAGGVLVVLTALTAIRPFNRKER
ncbi:MAG: phosphatase PAP2 family protein, partial [Nocardioides sp.]